MHDKNIINRALDYTRDAVGIKLAEVIDKKRNLEGAYKPLYDVMSDYPAREGKGLRPTLCISAARGAGGFGHSALVSAAAIELFHNGALIKDDIADESKKRRKKETLHELIGVPCAVNTGDATNVLAISLLLENLPEIGVAKTLHVLHEIEQMARQSVEGQSMELDWIAKHVYNLNDEDYFRMCAKKTCWYTFITPCRVGYIIGASHKDEIDMLEELNALTRFGMFLGIAFQIQDDLLNLLASFDKYGKETAGDLYEGKRTIMLNHLIKHSGKNRKQIISILDKKRDEKTAEEVEFLMQEMIRCGSIAYGQALSSKLALKARKLLNSLKIFRDETPIQPGEAWEEPMVDLRFIRELVNYVIERDL
jgi:geranylgeranyl diphosphate synthase, type II